MAHGKLPVTIRTFNLHPRTIRKHVIKKNGLAQENFFVRGGHFEVRKRAEIEKVNQTQ
jgi:hypothetical protein